FRNATSTPKLVVGRVGHESVWRTGLAGFVLQISNPKAIMFWLAIASVGGVGDAPLPVVALFVVVAFVHSFLGHGGYALLLSSAPVRGAYMRARRWIEAGIGCFFLFASFKLATSRISRLGASVVRLLQKRLHPLQRPEDILLGVRVAQSDIAFAQNTEVGSSNQRHARILQKLGGRLLRLPAGLRHVGECIERPLRRDAG